MLGLDLRSWKNTSYWHLAVEDPNLLYFYFRVISLHSLGENLWPPFIFLIHENLFYSKIIPISALTNKPVNDVQWVGEHYNIHLTFDMYYFLNDFYWILKWYIYSSLSILDHTVVYIMMNHS